MNKHTDIANIQETFRSLSDITKLDHAFVLGMPKSGTTWVQNLLNAHHEIICRGETNTPQRWLEPLNECVAKYNHHTKNSGFDKVYLTPEHHDYLFLNGVLMVMKQWLIERDSPNIRMIAERTPNRMAERIESWNHYFPKSRFLHIIRDPRDAAISGWLFWTRRESDRMSERYPNIEAFFDEYIPAWTRQIQRCRQAAEPIQERYLEFKYEDLINQPESTLSNILSFLGVAATPTDVTQCLQAASFEKMVGRSTGEEDFTGSKYRKGVIGDWVNHINADAVNNRYGEILKQFGYS